MKLKLNIVNDPSILYNIFIWRLFEWTSELPHFALRSYVLSSLEMEMQSVDSAVLLGCLD